MASYNRVVMIGNLTRDPDYKQLASGQAVCRLGIATNRQFKNRQTGSMVQEVCYIDIDVWGAQAESCRQYLQKGRPVLVEGRLKFDSWEDPNGQTRSKHSIVADRVVFLAAGAQAEELAEEEPGAVRSNGIQAAKRTDALHSTRPEPQNETERALFDQIDQIKSRNQQKTAKKKETEAAHMSNLPGGEIEFKDQPPFEDDLPF
jgi:single-strand DNA-binding protein